MGALQKTLREVENVTWYHTIDLGHGIITKGAFDHRPMLNLYDLPLSLEGKTVLDVGASSGFFSFEFERRGAKRVTAIDVRWENQDISSVVERDGYLETSSSGILSSQKKHGLEKSSFEIAKEILNSNVEHKEISVYDISPDNIGCFDFVFCGSLLLHLTDNYRAIKNIYNVTKELAIFATCVDDMYPNEPIARFFNNASDRVFWIPNMKCLVEMGKAVGFSDVKEGAIFDLTHKDGHNVTHGIIKCYR